MKESLKQISDLVKRFERNIEAYRSSAYNETQLRREFIDPFFETLGWDVSNKAGYAEQYKDVIHEDAIKIAGATKAPDYCFRIGGVRKFFLETKKPSVDIKEQTSPAYQLRRYAWSAKLPISILTDFEALAVYDCRLRPKPNDKPSIGRVRLYTYPQYLDRFEEIYNLLSKESVLKGSFDKFAESEKQKRGTTEVDAEFLKEIEFWREALAKEIALRNPKLSVRELNFAVQLTIDRIIFLRMCEDRGIEPYGQIQNLLNGTNTYRRLREIFYHADDKYNSGLFDFKTDQLTPALKVDDKPLKDIFKNLYYPESPYEFSVLGADILGHVYEQFLGKVIRLTEGHRAKVEEKPEVRKAGGVYYTPTYIVDYIVKNTVGKIVGAVLRDRPEEGADKGPPPHRQLSPQQISKIRILDPACGSGSFLLGAYQYLLDYHLNWYLAHHSKKGDVAQGFSPAPKEMYRGRGGQWYLTIQEKKRILLNNIYGVDIDPQAVEVTKLSLLLKVLEGENQDTLERQMKLFKERALPDLGSNIKCGNSLIGPDFYQGEQMNFLENEEIYRINPFDWQKEFPEIMKGGGFDAVIGNPPYILLQDEFRDDQQLQYFRQTYEGAYYKLDTYHLFIEQGIRLCRKAGRLSLITPSNFLMNNHLDRLRKVILRKTQPEEIVVVKGGVFAGVSVDNAIFIFRAGQTATSPFILKQSVVEQKGLKPTGESQVDPQRVLAETRALFMSGATTPSSALWNKVSPLFPKLGDIADVNFGKQLRDRSKFTHDVIEVAGPRSVPRTHVACVTGKDVERYQLMWSKLACLNDRVAQSGGCWDEAKHEAKGKLLTRQIGKFPSFALDTFGYHCLNTIFMVTLRQTAEVKPSYILGLLNSKLLRTLWVGRFYDQRQTFPKIKGTYLKELPIAVPDLSNTGDRDRHNRMVGLVDQMLELHKQLPTAKTPDEKTRIQR